MTTVDLSGGRKEKKRFRKVNYAVSWGEGEGGKNTVRRIFMQIMWGGGGGEDKGGRPEDVFSSRGGEEKGKNTSTL